MAAHLSVSTSLIRISDQSADPEYLEDGALIAHPTYRLLQEPVLPATGLGDGR